ncbi:MAG: hypothetical protein ACK5MZ_04410 [Aestuariibaculum sp.]
MILISKYLIPKGYTGMAVYPFVFLKDKNLKYDKVLINHEKIHLRQQLELFILPFYIIYITEFVIRLACYRSWKQAYLNISFEREAYCNESNLNYLKDRIYWRFLKYFYGHGFQY